MVFEQLEEMLASIGLGDPAIRFIATAAAAAGLFWIVKPKLMFTNGKPRPWGEPASNPIGGGDLVTDMRPTLVTWYVGAAAVGTVFALFI